MNEVAATMKRLIEGLLLEDGNASVAVPVKKAWVDRLGPEDQTVGYGAGKTGAV